jgi:hypothetical protein
MVINNGGRQKTPTRTKPAEARSLTRAYSRTKPAEVTTRMTRTTTSYARDDKSVFSAHGGNNEKAGPIAQSSNPMNEEEQGRDTRPVSQPPNRMLSSKSP